MFPSCTMYVGFATVISVDANNIIIFSEIGRDIMPLILIWWIMMRKLKCQGEIWNIPFTFKMRTENVQWENSSVLGLLSDVILLIPKILISLLWAS